MRILQVSHYNHIVGGSDAVFFGTCDLLEQAGHDVVRFCMAHPKNEPSRWSGYFPGGADTANARLRDTIRYFYNQSAVAQLNRLLDEAGPVDVAHIHIYHGKQTPAILRVLRRRGIPVIHTLHEYKLACPVYTMQRHGAPCQKCISGSDLNAIRFRCKDHSLIRSGVMAAEKMSSRLLGDVRLVDRFLCVSAFQKNVMKKAGIADHKLSVLHNFVSTPATTQAPTGHRNYLLYIGRIEALKGLATLIAAVKKGGQHLVIAGSGSWLAEMQAQIADAPNIDYIGFIGGGALRDRIAQARAVVVPSEWYENCPMSVLEAKALGRPVIGASIGGIPELVRDGIDGFLFEPGDKAALARALARLDNADHAVLSQQALSDIETRFSADRHLDQLLNHYGAVRAPLRAAQTIPA